jgi:hypothetical protein
MNNPFEKKGNTGLIIVIASTAVTAGAFAYLYLTKSGANNRISLKHRLKDLVKDQASGFISRKTGISKKAIKKVADHLFE